MLDVVPSTSLSAPGAGQVRFVIDNENPGGWSGNSSQAIMFSLAAAFVLSYSETEVSFYFEIISADLIFGRTQNSASLQTCHWKLFSRFLSNNKSGNSFTSAFPAPSLMPTRVR